MIRFNNLLNISDVFPFIFYGSGIRFLPAFRKICLLPILFPSPYFFDVRTKKLPVKRVNHGVIFFVTRSDINRGFHLLPNNPMIFQSVKKINILSNGAFMDQRLTPYGAFRFGIQI